MLLIDSQLGSRSLTAVAESLGAGTVVWPASTARTILGALQAEQVLLGLLDSAGNWSTAVGLGFGCGPAAALVAAGRADRAILIDPPHLLTGDPTLAAAHRADLVPERIARGQEALPAALAEVDPRGPFPDGFYLATALQVTDDVALQQEFARVWRSAEEERQPYDLSLGLQPRDKERLNWLAVWLRPELDTTVWLPTERSAYGAALAALGPGRSLVRRTWGPLAWLSEPEALAADLAAIPEAS